MEKLTALLSLAKASPVKTTGIILGTAAVITGVVIGVKYFRKDSEEVVEEVKAEAKPEAEVKAAPAEEANAV